MKKLVTLILSLLLIFSFTACEEKTSPCAMCDEEYSVKDMRKLNDDYLKENTYICDECFEFFFAE